MPPRAMPPRAMPPRPRRLPTPVEPVPAAESAAEPAPVAGPAPAASPVVQNEAEASESAQAKALRLAQEWQMFFHMAQAAMEEMKGLQLPGMTAARPADEPAGQPRPPEPQ